ncbi:hypothetical protein VZT92_025414 [Zoarces viviparus]|uniref:Immunoglobulin domain-containing protein n=1 Tax=Zoarces viviparus TaxID=48416 RepID=A0AAW1DXQ7_ZOAVI
MKVRHTLICFFFLSLQDGNNGLVKAQIYARTEGGDVTVQCSSSPSGSRIILCKEPCKQENNIIETTDDRAHEGRFSIERRNRDVSVTITQLTKSDSGLYQCGSGSSYRPFEIIVVDALLDDSSEETTFYPRSGGNILVGCYFSTTETRKYFCKGRCKENDILVETAAYGAQRGRYSIRYVNGYSSGGFVYVGITQLTSSDSGRYRCGLDKPFSPDSYYSGFNIVVTDAPTTSNPNQAMTSSVPSASTATGSSRPATRAPTGVWLYAVIVVVVVVIVSGLVLMIFCSWRNIKPDGLNTSRTSGGTNTEIALYENCGPVSTCEDSTYQSLHPASRDQDQTYSTLTHTQHA